MKEGVLWHVGNGANIKIWENPWVINDEIRFITSERIEGLKYVCNLIEYESIYGVESRCCE